MEKQAPVGRALLIASSAIALAQSASFFSPCRRFSWSLARSSHRSTVAFTTILHRSSSLASSSPWCLAVSSSPSTSRRVLHTPMTAKQSWDTCASRWAISLTRPDTLVPGLAAFTVVLRERPLLSLGKLHVMLPVTAMAGKVCGA